jgi:hypothetical protein
MVANYLGLDAALWPTRQEPLESPIDFGWEGWLKHVSQQLGDIELIAGVVWPPQLDRERVYAHLIDRQGYSRGFAKISFDAYNDHQLDSEAKALRQLRLLNLKHTYQPEVLSQGTWAGHRYLIAEPIPEHVRPVSLSLQYFPDQWVKEFAGMVQRLTRAEIEQLFWWQRFCETSDVITAFAEEANGALIHGVDVCRVHGDFCSHNMAKDGQRLWLFDWEHSSEYGPLLTDRLRLWLDLYQRQIFDDPAQAMRRFSETYLKPSSPMKRCEIVMALAYLHAVGIATATRLIEYWPLL